MRWSGGGCAERALQVTGQAGRSAATTGSGNGQAAGARARQWAGSAYGGLAWLREPKPQETGSGLAENEGPAGPTGHAMGPGRTGQPGGQRRAGPPGRPDEGHQRPVPRRGDHLEGAGSQAAPPGGSRVCPARAGTAPPARDLVLAARPGGPADRPSPGWMPGTTSSPPPAPTAAALLHRRLGQRLRAGADTGRRGRGNPHPCAAVMPLHPRRPRATGRT